MNSALIRSIAVAGLLSVSVGCLPRGETVTLDQVLQAEKQRYAHAMASQPQTPVASTLTSLEKTLAALSGGATDNSRVAASDLSNVAEALNELVGHAGYPSRPAFGEIISQYRVLALNEAPQRNTVKLLVARTYGLLAAELEGVRFGV